MRRSQRRNARRPPGDTVSAVLPSPTHVVVGASNLEASASFLAVFGFASLEEAVLPPRAARELYGIDGALLELRMAMPGADRGWVRLIETPHPPREFAAFDNRPFAIDLFSADVERSLHAATSAGFSCSPIANHVFGPITVREAEVHGPDHLVLTLLETNARRPSLLDREPDRLHSEVHALVWSAQGIDSLLEFWTAVAGHEVLSDFSWKSRELGPLLGVGERELEVRLAVWSDGEANPVRLEMIEFLGQEAASHPSLPLAAGLHAPAFSVPDLEAVLARLTGAEPGTIVELDTALHGPARAATAVAPGGLRFELWEAAR